MLIREHSHVMKSRIIKAWIDGKVEKKGGK